MSPDCLAYGEKRPVRPTISHECNCWVPGFNDSSIIVALALAQPHFNSVGSSVGRGLNGYLTTPRRSVDFGIPSYRQISRHYW
jgi:hypothetical protein